MQTDYNDVIQLMDNTISEDNNLENEANCPLYAKHADTEHTDTMNEVEIDEAVNNDIEMNVAVDNNHNNNVISNHFYVRMMGVPFTSNHDDIKQFFEGLEIIENGIFFAVNCSGNRTGEVFVTFNTRLAMNEALKRHREYIDNRYIEIYETTKAKLQELIKISQGISIPQRNLKIFVVKLKGFSFDADEEKIRAFLGQLQPYELHIIYDYKNRNSGTAFVQYLTQNEVSMVHKLNRKYLGNRYINVYPSNLSELRLALAQLIGCNLPYNLNPYLNCLRMEGLPLDSEHGEILSFFMRINVIPKKLHIKPNSSLAFAEFANPLDCQLALTRNGSSLRGCSIYLFQVSKYELRSIVGGNCNNNNKENDIVPSMDYSYEYNNYHNNTRIDKKNNNNTNNMKCYNYIKQNNPNNHYNHNQIQPYHRSQSYQCPLPHSQPLQYANNNFCNHNNHNHNNYNNNNHNNNHKYLVFIRGIPFDATYKDIIDFFKSYPSFDTSAIKFINDTNGRFTGQAIVSFFSEFEAKNACDCLNRKYIGRRYVVLTML